MSTGYSMPAADPATTARMGEADLRITAVETFRISDRFLLVKVSSDAGIAGWGEPILESRAETVEAAVRELADLLIGEPVQIGRLWQRMHKSGFYRGGPILGSAVAGLDQALWDVLGKALGVPVHVLLGGPVRDVLPLYAPANGADDAALVDRAQELVDAGYRMVKTAPEGPRDFLETPARLHATMRRWERLAEAIGPDRTFAIDFHGRVSAADSRVLLAELEPLRPAFVEEPLPPEFQGELRALTAATTVPIATGERLYDRWEAAGVIDSGVRVLQPDLSHCFGISEAMRIAAVASLRNIALAPHCATGPVAFAACAQLGFAVQEVMVQECHLELHDPGAGTLARFVDPASFTVRDGALVRPSAPGLGITVDEDAVRAAAADPQRHRSPVWQRTDGSYAEW
ncbi:galactonate dehydratase [Ruania rhizosphaerae]|uniref:galactonate dehydratase n=1 Tax=Ruania rhizosphaerae TaxID=1840413 RepID=UPI001F2326FA|nr:galactonate dehydratase [Ruania rhizosphaerae]